MLWRVIGRIVLIVRAAVNACGFDEWINRFSPCLFDGWLCNRRILIVTVLGILDKRQSQLFHVTLTRSRTGVTSDVKQLH